MYLFMLSDSLRASLMGSPQLAKTELADHTLMEFTDLRDMSQVKIKVRTLNLRNANFQPFKELLSSMLQETAFRDKEADQSWQMFKDACHRMQELSISCCKKSGKEGKKYPFHR